MTDPIADLRRREYVARINRVMDYICQNLDGDLRLRKLADVAGFSPYHFHRLFKAMVGETINQHIRRVRVELAAGKLIHNPVMPVTEIAYDCGYSSPAAFAREFKHFFGMSATEFRGGGFEDWSKIRQAEGKMFKAPSNDGKAGVDHPYYTDRHRAVLERRSSMQVTYETTELPQLHVAYVRHTGPYTQIGGAFEQLMKWAGPRGLVKPPETQFLAVYHDSPEITEESKLRSDACITVPDGTEVAGEVAQGDIPGGTFAVGHFEIDVEEYGAAWDKLMCEYLPASGYQPDDGKCYELYKNDPDQHPEKKHFVDICLPVKPL